MPVRACYPLAVLSLVLGLVSPWSLPPARPGQRNRAGGIAGAAPTAWGWESFTFKNDLWLALHQGDVKQFDFRIGAGGALSEMRDCTEDDLPLLSPTDKGEVTDRDRAVDRLERVRHP